MSDGDKVSTAREALVAELLGDVREAIDRLDLLRFDLERADAGARATADALRESTRLYQTQVDDLVKRMRVEMSAVVVKSTEHAARVMVEGQTAILKAAAKEAFAFALSQELMKRTRTDWYKLAATCGLGGGLVALAVVAATRWLH